MTSEQPRYLAYMLRLWKIRSGTESVWRASLESPRSGERQGFASLEALFAFLEERTRGSDVQDTPGVQESKEED